MLMVGFQCSDLAGLSINYIVLNFIGYTFYSTYNVYGYEYDPPYNSGQIHLSDLIFSLHGLFMTSIQIVLVLFYPRTTNVAKPVWMVMACLAVLTVTTYAIINPTTEDIVKLMGLMKVAISFVKYVPQVYLNWLRKSTVGWSLENVLLDLSGGVLSLLQIFVDYLDTNTTSQFSSNLNFAKFLLGLVTIGFDMIFIFQHYVLYRRTGAEPGIEYAKVEQDNRINEIAEEDENERDTKEEAFKAKQSTDRQQFARQETQNSSNTLQTP